MGVWSIVNFRDLEGVLRIDAEYYQPHLLEAKQDLANAKCPVVTLGNLVTSGYRVVYENTEILNEEYNPQQHVKFLQAANVNSGFPSFDVENMGLVSIADWNRYPQGRIKRGELLIEVKGKAEKVAVVPDDFPENVMVSGSLYKMTLDSSRVDPYYILAYMLSRYGCGFRDRGKTNTLISYVNKEDLYSIPTPLVNLSLQKEVADLCRKAEAQYKQSKALYTEAEKLLLYELHLDTLDLSHQLTYERNFSELHEAKRFDAEYYQPKYYRLLQAVRQSGKGYKRLDQIVEPVRNGFDFREFSEEGTPYIRVADIRNSRINLSNAARILISIADVKKDVELKVGDVLFTRKGTFGQSAVVQSGQEHSIISSEIMLLRLMTKQILPEYLSLFLNALPGYMQVERRVHGVAYFSISQPDLATVEVPLLPLETQERIVGKAQQSLQAERDAKQLLEAAKKRVEEMILSQE